MSVSVDGLSLAKGHGIWHGGGPLFPMGTVARWRCQAEISVGNLAFAGADNKQGFVGGIRLPHRHGRFCLVLWEGNGKWQMYLTFVNMYRERANANPWNLSGDCSELLRIFGHASNVHTFAYIFWIHMNTNCINVLLPSFFTLLVAGFSATRVRCHQRGGSSVKRLRCSQCFQSHCKVLYMLLSAQWWLSAGSAAVHQLQILPGLQASWKQAAEVLTKSLTQWSTLAVPESWSDNKSIQNQSKCKDVDVFFLFVFLELISFIFEPSTNQAKHLRYRRPVSMESRVHRFKATCVGGSSWGLGIFSFLVSFL